MRTVRLSFVYEKEFLVKHRLSAGARVEFRRLHFTPSLITLRRSIGFTIRGHKKRKCGVILFYKCLFVVALFANKNTLARKNTIFRYFRKPLTDNHLAFPATPFHRFQRLKAQLLARKSSLFTTQKLCFERVKGPRLACKSIVMNWKRPVFSLHLAKYENIFS